jgi:hypothetical protein
MRPGRSRREELGSTKTSRVPVSCIVKKEVLLSTLICGHFMHVTPRGFRALSDSSTPLCVLYSSLLYTLSLLTLTYYHIHTDTDNVVLRQAHLFPWYLPQQPLLLRCPSSMGSFVSSDIHSASSSTSSQLPRPQMQPASSLRPHQSPSMEGK